MSFIGHNRALNPAQCNQVAWSIVAVYEKPDLEVSHIKLIATETPLSANENDWFKAEEYVMFDNPLDPSREVELIGVYTAGGVNSWPGNPAESSDETWAVLEDESEQLLEETEYDGKTVFAGRTSTDFARLVVDIPEENRSHDYTGGELDVFDETLSSDFFNNHQVIGYHIRKTGYNIMVPVLFGIRQAVDTSKATITAHIPADDPTYPTVNIENTGVASICNIEVETPLSSIGNPTAISTEPAENVDVTVNDGKLVLNADSLATSSTITLNLTVPENTDEIINIDSILKYRLSVTGTCGDNLDDANSVEITAIGSDIVYRVLTRYVDESGEEIAEATRIYAHTGDNYTTAAKTVEGYTLSTIPEGNTGIINNEPVTITYVYTKNEESKDDEPKDDEPKDDEPKDDEPKDDESKDDESKDDESKDDESKDDESKDDEADKKEGSPAVPNTGSSAGQNGAAFATASALGAIVSGVVLAILLRFARKK